MKLLMLINRLFYKPKELERTMRGVQKTNKNGDRLLRVYVEINGEGFTFDDYVSPQTYDLALDYAIASADKWLQKYRQTVGIREGH